jgi:hypothetical protein
MPNPPYSGFVLIVRENQDGGNAKCYIFNEVAEGSPVPKGVNGLEGALFSGLDTAKVPKDAFVERNFSSRTALKNGLGVIIDVVFPDTTA